MEQKQLSVLFPCLYNTLTPLDKSVCQKGLNVNVSVDVQLNNPPPPKVGETYE